MNRLSAMLFALALATPLAACTEQEDESFRDVIEFQDGMAIDSDTGAFRVTLSSADGGMGVGRNDLVVRIGFHDPSAPNAEGRGVPGADLLLETWRPGTESVLHSEVEYLGDGAYAIENVLLDAEGVWNMDLEIAVGEGMYETCTLAFEIEKLDYR